MNVTNITGNLTADPESRTLESGNTVTNFTIANNRSYTKEGEKREETTFIPVECWSKTAELCAQYLSKGRKVGVTGRLKSDSWETQEGDKRSRLVIVANEVDFLSPPLDSNSETNKVDDRPSF